MINQILKEIETMTDAEKQAVLAAEVPAEMEKEAEAYLDTVALGEALYNYGALQGELAVANSEGLDKVASEDLEAHNTALAEVSAEIDTHMQNLGFDAIEDQVEFHKEAQVAAGIIFEGYADSIEKLAKGKGAGAVAAFMAKAKKHGEGAAKHVAKHKGKYALGAGAAAAGGYGAHKLMAKKANEATLADIVDAIDARDLALVGRSELEGGLDKLAAKGAGKGKAIMAHIKGLYGKAKKHGEKAVEHVKKYSPAYAGGAGLGVGAVAGRASKE